MDRPLWKFLLNVAIGLGLAMLVSASRGVFSAETSAEACMYLSDGFFVAGAILFGWGCLRWTYNGGVMDGLTFTFKLAVARIRREYEEDRKTFGEYREEREKKSLSPKYLLLSGLVHLAIALIFFGLYLNI